MSPKSWRRTRLLLVAALALLIVPLTAGAIYQWLGVRAEAGRYPPPGTLVDIGGRRLHLVCIGEPRPGEPTVIFEPSGFGGALSFEKARAEVRARTRVCSYDRAGTGWSDPGPPAMSTGVLVGDLERLLRRGAIPPPYVLVSSSIGGLTTELFARRHADWVAGLVFLDAANSDTLDRAAWLITGLNIETVCSARWAARFGILRLADPFHFRGQLPAEDAARSIAKLYTVGRMTALCGMARGFPAGIQELRDAPAIAPDVPLTVLSAESSEGLLPPGLIGLRAKADVWRDDWLAGQQQFARRSRRGTWRVVPGSGHLIASSHPHVVAEAVLDVLGQIWR
jgi:pimeloyl-ACP methyl ester carboxylesterase